MTYKGEPQEKICVTKLIFWNKGRATINGEDIVDSDPLRIQLPDGARVLDVQMVSASNRGCLPIVDANYVVGGSDYGLRFEYLDHRDYFIVQIVHAGLEDVGFKVTGKIKGARSISESMAMLTDRQNLDSASLITRFEQLADGFMETRYGAAAVFGFMGGLIAWMIHASSGNKWFYLLPGFLFLVALAALIVHRDVPPVKI